MTPLQIYQKRVQSDMKKRKSNTESQNSQPIIINGHVVKLPPIASHVPSLPSILFPSSTSNPSHQHFNANIGITLLKEEFQKDNVIYLPINKVLQWFNNPTEYDFEKWFCGRMINNFTFRGYTVTCNFGKAN